MDLKYDGTAMFGGAIDIEAPFTTVLGEPMHINLRNPDVSTPYPEADLGGSFGAGSSGGLFVRAYGENVSAFTPLVLHSISGRTTIDQAAVAIIASKHDGSGGITAAAVGEPILAVLPGASAAFGSFAVYRGHVRAESYHSADNTAGVTSSVTIQDFAGASGEILVSTVMLNFKNGLFVGTGV
jgi:hypothetical protein